MPVNQLFYGDNLDLLPSVADESVDLVYLDPPFNSNRGYNVIFARHDTSEDASAQIHAFDDTWRWTPVTERQFIGYINGGLPNEVADALTAFHALLGENDATAYLVNMAPRLVQLHRVLKPTGTLWLHCDPTMSHYLKVLLDAIFGGEEFRNEVIWQRSTGKSLMTRRLPNNHDVLLSYGKTDDAKWVESAAFQKHHEDALDDKTASKYRHRDEAGRLYRLDSLINPNRDRPNLTYEFLGVTRVWRWTRDRMQRAYDAGLVVQTAPGRVPQFKRYLDEGRGRPFSDVWTDIPPINSRAAERLGYPTQKPLALLERIISLTTEPGDVVLDPFCGCGTTIDAAQKLDRRWVGMDITFIAVHLIQDRLRRTYGDSIELSYEMHGIPQDKASALALFERSEFEFERWAVTRIGARPNEKEKQRGDKGIDGVARFPLDASGGIGRVIVSVKGGRNLNPSMVRDLGGTVSTQKADMGVLITNWPPTRGMIDEANHAGVYTHRLGNQDFPRIQIISVDDLLAGRRPDLPSLISPYAQAQRATTTTPDTLFDV